ncbi:MAG: hypothetical protein OQK05_14070 [Pseudopelagicola sp.]|nr:hypothetical protein [Pseudopelagicola sp.]
MKRILPLALMATPAAAHDASQAHLHSEGPEGLIVAAALVAVCVGMLLYNKARK